ncbi:MAG: hypothetical protein ACERKV_11030 [Clostridiaceae bacterium]
MKMEKIISLVAVIMLAMSTVAFATSKEKETGDENSKIVVWTLSEDLNKFADYYVRKYPNKNVIVVVVDPADYLTKITTALTLKSDVPDVIVGEHQMLSYYYEAGLLEELNQEPYDIEQYKADIAPYVYEAGTDQYGNVRAISYQVALGDITYRRDFAKEIRENDDPEFIAEKFKTNVTNLACQFGATIGPKPYIIGGTFLGISTHSKNKDAAWDFIKFCTLDSEVSQWWVGKSNGEDNKDMENLKYQGEY